MKFSLSLIAFCIILSINAQEASITIIPEKQTDRQSWTNLNMNNSMNDFQFAIVTDRTGGHRSGVFPDAVKKLNLLQPEFVMSVGDLIEGYTEDKNVLEREWKEFDGFVNKLDMPFFYVPGNHDITNQVMEDLWYEKFGNTFYAFTYKEVLFLCLNSEDQRRGAGKGTISDKQFEWIKKTLKDNSDVKWTLVFMHQPLWTQDDTKRWKDVENLLSDRKHNVFTGHYHRYTKYERNNGKYFVLATTGGGSSLRGPSFGEFDHVVWVTMKDEGPIVANLLLEGIWDENVLVSEMRNAIEDMETMNPFSFELIFTDEVKQSKIPLKLKVKNDKDIPMNLFLRPGINFDQALFANTDSIKINPNSVETTELLLTQKDREANSDPDPVSLNLTIEYKGDYNLNLPFTYKIKPIKRYSISDSKTEIKIDGDVSEWGDLHYKIPGKTGSLSATFDLRIANSSLCMAAKVKDDKIINYGSGSPWIQDYIGLCMNAEFMEKSAMSVGRNWYNDEMYFLQTPQDGIKETQIWPRNKLPEGSAYQCVKRDYGYDMEWSIPLSYIHSFQGENWESFRFNVMVGDKDLDSEDPKMYFWQPNWRGSDNYLGSGTFVLQK